MHLITFLNQVSAVSAILLSFARDQAGIRLGSGWDQLLYVSDFGIAIHEAIFGPLQDYVCLKYIPVNIDNQK